MFGLNAFGAQFAAPPADGDWAPPPECRVIDTLIAGRLILPNLDRLDGEVVQRTKDKAFGKVFGKHTLQAWGVRLGLMKVGTELENWAEWTPEIQASVTVTFAIE